MDPQRLGLQSVQRVLLKPSKSRWRLCPLTVPAWRFAWMCLSLKAVYKTAARPLR
jgi:hypothetical protein